MLIWGKTLPLRERHSQLAIEALFFGERLKLAEVFVFDLREVKPSRERDVRDKPLPFSKNISSHLTMFALESTHILRIVISDISGKRGIN